MNSRTDKYYDEENVVGSRTKRNDKLYKDINKTELDNFSVRSNATVIGNNKGNNIDVEKIKSILDTHYNDAPKRRSIRLENYEEEPKKQPIIETKEYDINVILDKAKEDKVEDYKEDRSKKLRDTQFDILNNLNIDPKDYIEDYEDVPSKEDNKRSGASDDLQKLIDTIALNENDIKNERIKVEKSVKITPVEDAEEQDASDDLEKQISKINTSNSLDTDPLDIFEDLKGDENTTVLEGLQEKTESLLEDMQSVTETLEKSSSIDKSFFTKSTEFKKQDFEEYEEFEDVDKPMSSVVKIIIAILVIIFIAGIAILVKSFL